MANANNASEVGHLRIGSFLRAHRKSSSTCNDARTLGQLYVRNVYSLGAQSPLRTRLENDSAVAVFGGLSAFVCLFSAVFHPDPLLILANKSDHHETGC